MSNVLIAGASRGIGLGLARAYLEQGDQVIVIARQPEHAPQLAQLQQRHPAQLQVIACDLNNVNASATIVAALPPQHLDRVILNAGISGPKEQAPEHLTDADISALFLTNAIAPMRLARALRPRIPPGGVLAFTSSILGSVQLALSPDMALYGASKAALNSLIRNWSSELRDTLDFHLLALHPGWVRTDMGGAEAPLSVEESVQGLMRVIEHASGRSGCAFLDHQGQILPW